MTDLEKQMFFKIGDIKGEMNQLDEENRALLTKINSLNVLAADSRKTGRS